MWTLGLILALHLESTLAIIPPDLPPQERGGQLHGAWRRTARIRAWDELRTSCSGSQNCEDLQSIDGNSWVDQVYNHSCTAFHKSLRLCARASSADQFGTTAGEACCLCGGGSCVASHAENPLTRQSLMGLYAATKGHNWSRSTDWASNRSYCNWYGVLCTGGTSEVSSLFLIENSLSGTLGTSLAALTSLTGMEINNNLLMGTLGTGFASLTSLTEIEVQENMFSGTLSASFASLTALKRMFVDFNSKISGTLEPSFSSWTALTQLFVAGTLISGSLPSSLASLTSLKYLDLGMNRISGSSSAGFVSWSKLIFFAINRNYALDWDLQMLPSWTKLSYVLMESCSIRGNLPAAEMRDAALKVLMLNNNLVSGTVPQLGLHTSQKLNTLILSNNPISGTISAPVPKLKDLLLNNMRISGTLKSLISEDNQTQSELAVFGLSRNLLTGSTDALEPATALETLILAGNMFECTLVDLEPATKLGVGRFEDPTIGALKSAANDIYKETGERWGQIPNLTFPNIALFFAGNIELTSDAAIFPPIAPVRSVRVDYVENGRRELFPGESEFWLLIALTIPAMVLLYSLIVVVSTTTGVLDFVRSTLYLEEDNPIVDHVLNLVVTPLLMLAVAGVFLGAVNFTFNHHTCSSFVTRMTTSGVDASTIWQWLWVVLSGFASTSTLLLLVCTLPCGEHHFTPKAHRELWLTYTCASARLADPRADGAAAKRGIREWAFKVQNTRPIPIWCLLLSLVLHVPILCLATVPAFVFVLAENLPSGGSWYESILKNSFVVAMVKLSISSLLFPKAVNVLAQIQHNTIWHWHCGLIQTELSFILECKIEKSKANSLLLFEVVTVLVAPMFACFFFDESCLRFYLAFAPVLKSIMDAWGIGQLGISAYRHQFCSRALVSSFSWVWISMLSISTFAVPAVRMLALHPKVLQFKTELARLLRQITCKDDEEEAAQIQELEAVAEEQQTNNVSTYRSLLIIVAFGSLSPLLFILGPVFGFTKLCALNWIQQRRKSIGSMHTVSQLLEPKLLVQQPTELFVFFAIILQWMVAAVLFIDLEFGVGPISLYLSFSVFQVTALGYFYRQASVGNHPVFDRQKVTTRHRELIAALKQDLTSHLLDLKPKDHDLKIGWYQYDDSADDDDSVVSHVPCFVLSTLDDLDSAHKNSTCDVKCEEINEIEAHVLAGLGASWKVGLDGDESEPMSLEPDDEREPHSSFTCTASTLGVRCQTAPHEPFRKSSDQEIALNEFDNNRDMFIIKATELEDYPGNTVDAGKTELETQILEPKAGSDDNRVCLGSCSNSALCLGSCSNSALCLGSCSNSAQQ